MWLRLRAIAGARNHLPANNPLAFSFKGVLIPVGTLRHVLAPHAGDVEANTVARDPQSFPAGDSNGNRRGELTHTTTEGEPTDTGRRDHTGRGRQAERLGCPVEISELRTPVNACGTTFCITLTPLRRDRSIMIPRSQTLAPAML